MGRQLSQTSKGMFEPERPMLYAPWARKTQDSLLAATFIELFSSVNGSYSGVSDMTQRDE